MSRIELHCPSCGYDVKPTLLPPPSIFTCPECQETVPREKLSRIKVLHRQIAGAFSSWNVTQAAVVAIEHGDTTTISSPEFWVPPGAMVIAIVGAAAGSAATGPDSVKLNNTDAMTLAVGTSATEPTLQIYYYNAAVTTSGRQSVVADFTTTTPQDRLITALVVQGQIAGNPVDKTAVNTGITFSSLLTWTSPSSGVQTTAGNLAIGAVMGDSFVSLNLEMTTGPEWTRQQYVNDSDNGTGVCFIINATQLVPAKAAVTFRGTCSQDQRDAGETYSAVVATFKHA